MDTPPASLPLLGRLPPDPAVAAAPGAIITRRGEALADVER